jgi:hypothetical protein
MLNVMGAGLNLFSEENIIKKGMPHVDGFIF